MYLYKANMDSEQADIHAVVNPLNSNVERRFASDMTVIDTATVSPPIGRTQNIAVSALFDRPSGVDITSDNAKYEVDELPDGACVSPHNVAIARTESETTTARTVEYVGSFSVVGEDQNERAQYVRKQLMQMRNIQKLKPVLLAVSLTGIKVCHSSGKSVFMAHALKRISYATCDPEFRQFSFLAREPKGYTTMQYCHAFFTTTSQEAEELNAIVGNAFRMAHAAEQEGLRAAGATPGGQDGEAPPPTSPPAPSFNRVIERQLEEQRAAAERRVSARQGALQQQLERISTARVSERSEERRRLRQSQLVEKERTREVERLEGKEKSTWAKQVVNRARHRAPFQGGGGGGERGSRRDDGSPSPADGPGAGASSRALSQLLDSSGRAYGSPVMTLKLHIDSHYQSGAHTNIRQLEEYMQQAVSGSPTPGTGPGGSPHTDSAGGTACSTPSPQGGRAAGRPGRQTDHRGSTDSNSSSSSCLEDSGTAAAAANTNGVVLRAKKVRPLSGRYQNTGLQPAEGTPAPPGGGEDVPLPEQHAASLSEQLRHAPWFQAGIPREMALEILSHQAIGAFIVRTSSSHRGCYALSVKVPKYDNPAGIAHYLLIRLDNGHFRVNGLDKEWPTLTALVTHHTVMPEMLPCTLRLPRVCRNPSFRDTDHEDDEKRGTHDTDVNCDQMLANLKL